MKLPNSRPNGVLNLGIDKRRRKRRDHEHEACDREGHKVLFQQLPSTREAKDGDSEESSDEDTAGCAEDGQVKGHASSHCSDPDG